MAVITQYFIDSNREIDQDLSEDPLNESSILYSFDIRVHGQPTSFHAILM
uniref:Uncharacterized protein n=1 Tax=Arundo donax TaxID=35708 RepID=A0A0A9FXR7_ARUDO